MQYLDALFDVLWEIKKLLWPERAAMILERKLLQDESEYPLSDMSVLLELYQRTGDEVKAKSKYEGITAMLRSMRTIVGPQFAREHCYVLVRVAHFEANVLGDRELGRATAQRALTIARTHAVASVIELIRHDFPEVYASAFRNKVEPDP